MKKIIFILPLAILMISAFANIIMAAHVSDVGTSIHNFESKAVVLSAHNDEMLQTLAGKQSLSQLKTYALANGFVPRSQIQVVGSQTAKIASIATQ